MPKPQDDPLVQIERTQTQLRASIKQTKQLVEKIRDLLKRARRQKLPG